MQRKLSILVLLSLAIKSIAPLTITRTTSHTIRANSPKIVPISGNFFARSTNGNQNELELLGCPENFKFDLKALKCKQISGGGRRLRSPEEDAQCPPNYRGTMTNPSNCRTFLDCWDGIGYVSPCSDHLLYNNNTKWCDWPDEANCCEFRERNPGQIVASE